MIFTSISIFSSHRQVRNALNEQLFDYTVVAITSEFIPGRPTTFIHDIFFEDYFYEEDFFYEYVTAFYTYTEERVDSNSLAFVPPPDISYLVYYGADVEGQIEFFINIPFRLQIYSDISMSSFFWWGNRWLINGKFAKTPYEVNISTQLAELNNLHVGDYIEIIIRPLGMREYLDFKIVGVFADYSEEIWSELHFVGHSIMTGSNSLTRNHILTAAPSSSDLIRFFPATIDIGDGTNMAITPNVREIRPGYFDFGGGFTSYGTYSHNGFQFAVFYVHDEQSIFAFGDVLEDILPETLAFDDSGGIARVFHRILTQTLNSFTWMLGIAGLVCIIFCILLLYYVLKSRTYNIGVLRARGMSRWNISLLLAIETLFVAIIGFLLAAVLYFIFFEPFIRYINFQNIFTIFHNWDFLNGSNFWLAQDGFRHAYEFTAPASAFDMLAGLVAIVGFVTIVSFFATLFIARNEPMKTLTML